MGLSLLGLYSFYRDEMTAEEQEKFNSILISNFRNNGWSGAEFMKELAERDKNPNEDEEDMDKLKRLVWQSIDGISSNPFGL